MKRTSITLVFATVFAAALSVTGQKPAARFVQDEVLVKFRAEVSEAQTARLNSRLGAAKLENLGDLHWQRVRVPAGSTVEKTIEKYRTLAEVEDAQPNYYYSLLLTPNDPLFNPPNTMYGLTKISAPAAWDLTTGSSAVVVADIDTGIRYTHEDLVANVWTKSGRDRRTTASMTTATALSTIITATIFATTIPIRGTSTATERTRPERSAPPATICSALSA